VFANYTYVTGGPMLARDSALRTWGDWGYDDDLTASHPWRAPGTAGVFRSGCGVFGGNPRGCDGVPREQGVPPDQCNGAGSALGVDAALLESQGAVTTWPRGSTQEVKFGLAANHGGGYSYRLCKKPANAQDAWQTEACFQQTVLEYASETQVAEYADGTRTAPWHAKRLRIGTWPEGSAWTMNPVTAFGGVSGQEPNATQFAPPSADAPVGFGPFDNVSVVDAVVVPADLEVGRYALSWRWDCEQTSQVWLSCAAIDIVDDSATKAATTRPPERRCGTPRGACGIDCDDATDPTTCLAFASSGVFTIQPSVCGGLPSDDDDDTAFAWFDDLPEEGLCDEEYLCGLSCADAPGGGSSYEACVLYFNTLKPLGRSQKACAALNGTWIKAADGAAQPTTQKHDAVRTAPTEEEEELAMDVSHERVDRIRAAVSKRLDAILAKRFGSFL